MAVLLPDCRLGVRRRSVASSDAHGEPVIGPPEPVLGPWPGRKREQPDGTWLLSVDVAAWPLRDGDLVVDPDADVAWLVSAATVLRNRVDPIVDYIRVEAQERRAGHTEPVGMLSPDR